MFSKNKVMPSLPNPWIQIDSETQKVVILFNRITTTLMLVSDGQTIGINYIVTALGNTYHSDTPFLVIGNLEDAKVNSDPEVRITITNWRKTTTRIGFHLKATVYKLGEHVVFEGELAGKIPNPQTIWAEFEALSVVD